MTLEECYKEIGGDYNGVMKRMGNSERIVKKFALKFACDPTAPELFRAFAEKDRETSFRMAHTLKGICLNLGFTELFELSSRLTESLRNETRPDAEELFEQVRARYDNIVGILGKMEP